MQRRIIMGLLFVWGLALLLILAINARALQEQLVYEAVWARAEASPTPPPSPTPTPTPTPTPLPDTVEFRGMWVTRFDWTSGTQPADPAKINEIVSDAAFAHINVIFFQVRANADAYYTPGLEPWAKRVSGTFGQPPNPYWDPLATLIQTAHAQGIQVHAYLNVYPVWDECSPPPENVAPRPFYYNLRDFHGTTGGKLNGLQWQTNDAVPCSPYMRASPASTFVDDHLLDVAADLVARYDVDGIHLDHIRYNSSDTSCDPVSEASAGVNCFTAPPAGYLSYADWQRTQVNGTVAKFYDQIVPLKPGLWLSAAVWPIYIDYWDWGGQEGYHDYYQDSKAWVAGGYIDSISPMIYPGVYDCDDPGFWTQQRWQTLVADFQANGGGRYVIPGIGTGYCTFSEIEARIQMGRALGVAGQALFSYGGLKANSYFDDLAYGPYAQPASVPTISWHP